jgi:hypothetical protein
MRETQQSTASLVELVKRITSSAQVQMKITPSCATVCIRSAPAREKTRGRRFCCSRRPTGGPVEVRPIASLNRYALSSCRPRPAGGRVTGHDAAGQDLLTALADELRGLRPNSRTTYDAGSGGWRLRAHANDSYVTSVSRFRSRGLHGPAGVQRIALRARKSRTRPETRTRAAGAPVLHRMGAALEAHLRDAESAARSNR